MMDYANYNKPQTVSARIQQTCDVLKEIKVNADLMKNVPGLALDDLTIKDVKELAVNASKKVALKNHVTYSTVHSKRGVQLVKLGSTTQKLSSEEFYEYVLRWLQGDPAPLKDCLTHNVARRHEDSDYLRIKELFV